MKIVHSADLHIGSSRSLLPLTGKISYLTRQLMMLRELESLCIRENADVLVLAGDVFDKAQPTQEEKDAFLHWLVLADELNKFDIVIIKGNHEEIESGKSALTIIDNFKPKWKRVHIATKPESFRIKNTSFLCIPFGYNIPKYAKKLYKNLDFKPDKVFVVGHEALAGLSTDTGYRIKGSHNLLDLDFVDAFLLGDIHKRFISSCGRIQMVGIPIQIGYTDKPNKGVSLINTKKSIKPTLVELNVPKLLIVKSVEEASKYPNDLVKIVSPSVLPDKLPENVVDTASAILEEEAVDYKHTFKITDGLDDALKKFGFTNSEIKSAFKTVNKMSKELSA